GADDPPQSAKNFERFEDVAVKQSGNCASEVAVKTMQQTSRKLDVAGFSLFGHCHPGGGSYKEAFTDIECRGFCVGSVGVAGECAERAARCRQHSRAQE